MIYLDNCSTTKPYKEVIDKMVEILEHDFANPSSLHRMGVNSEQILKDARKNISKFLSCRENEIYFTSGGTESNNIAIKGLIEKNKRKGKHIVTSAIEHPSVKNIYKLYEANGYKVTWLKVNSEGKISLEELKEAISKETALVSLFHVNNELGTILDLGEIIKEIKKFDENIYVHVDGVQGFGKIETNVKSLNCDTYSFSGHKIHGPKGIGGLYIRENINISPLVQGGGQEKNLRSGTENVPGIGGLSEAVLIRNEKLKIDYEHVKELKSYFLDKLKEKLDDYKVNSPVDSSPYIVNLSINYTRGEVLLHYLEEDKIYISTASACSSKGAKTNQVLEEIGVKGQLAEGTIRICLSKDIQKRDIDVFLDKILEYIDEIRKIIKR